ncbi:MAG: histidinol dehydrogenase, partial [Saprospiraceae bacterium]|nr:histidinol dehydrogenase [Saprospiraceae bacterium]
MKIYKKLATSAYKTVLQRPALDVTMLFDTVKNILTDIKTNGDAAVRKYAAKFDKVELTDFLVSEKEIQEAANQLDASLKKAILTAKKNIETFHNAQKSEVEVVETMPGVSCWRKSVGIEKVGLYVPGGTAPLFSTVLMLGVPAKLAGCNQIVLCSPPTTGGNIHPAVIFAAKTVGVTHIVKLGGVQAIGAMAYGTRICA